MRKYDKMTLKVAERIFENGDKLLEERKRKAAKIRHISYAVSGLCAAVIVCVGVRHFSSSMKMPNDNFHGSEIISETEPATTEINTSNVIEQTTTQTAIITTKTKSATQTTVTTSNAPQIGTSSQITTAHTTHILPTTTVQTITNQTAAVNTSETTTKTVTLPVTTTVQCNVTRTVPITTTIEMRATAIVTTTHEGAAIFPVTTTIRDEVSVPVSTTVVTTITELNSFFMNSTATLVINDNDESIFYEKQNEIISKDLIEGFIFAYYVQITKPDETPPTSYKLPVYRIADISKEEAVAVRTPDTYEYYLFRNINYKKEDEIS